MVAGILFTLSLVAQSAGGPFALSLSYFGEYLIRPGVKVGASFNLGTLAGSQAREKQWHWRLDPEFATYWRPDVNTNFLINTKGGLVQTSMEGKGASSVSIGLGYLLQSQIISETVSLGSGETEKNRQTRQYFLPTANYAFEKRFSIDWGWFIGYSIGMKISGTRESAMVMFLDCGTRYFLSK